MGRQLVVTVPNKEYDGKVAGVKFDNGRARIDEADTGIGVNRFNLTFEQLQDLFTHGLDGYSVEFIGATPQVADSATVTHKKVKE